jgi:hypothetical protein
MTFSMFLRRIWDDVKWVCFHHSMEHLQARERGAGCLILMTAYSEANSLHPWQINCYLNRYFMVYLSFSRQVLEHYLKIGDVYI